MLIAKTITIIRNFLSQEKKLGKKIAFVPTMGALHDGHLALIKKARNLAEIVVASIFVNKAQFNDLSDYEKYPRQFEKDVELLKEAGADYIFIPDDEEIYRNEISFRIMSTRLTDCLCGANRPGHFDGVALIIVKLFNIVKPDLAIFGEKDFQQFLLIKNLVRDLDFDVEIIGHELVRETSGLAMSSRNKRLSADAKIKAANIFRILLEIKQNPKTLPLKHIELLQIGFEKIDYLEIRDEENLGLITTHDALYDIPARIFIAVYLDDVRLIDNLRL
ncbi:MAG: pantoate--beta-alanine ligase [Alphaproteobacteria bacterium RIFCSPLOWO2_01_FULL_40_26]|nr:MAG: pantoate--beta-alanine ligase [Alphaproteobacteria bacterium RIFCSPHIGHO2_02_FULL_40_34]OFW88889.1 MAG: pantoate--beta-alanine ligase [Alphaproteobacteria bacterium RIFCSPHIGHO2_01_FULL_40_8]OFW94550.1 MAG: pantoate--beta-alanine ligase [Alphaproteobacteria bacterium RIFCSPLOWO2_01_FULL_40_26]OFX10299.1 MAG: pantoate--beta-alanine ligase [Alphaproteobacteria bacterium RIFCSPLOWO2_02_FULL_40_19]OFX11900.1 MAG: pantoate--beta-alanine ligase [Alphaproteobacteria bacterium RIFCSPLOWO2_12_FU